MISRPLRELRRWQGRGSLFRRFPFETEEIFSFGKSVKYFKSIFLSVVNLVVALPHGLHLSLSCEWSQNILWVKFERGKGGRNKLAFRRMTRRSLSFVRWVTSSSLPPPPTVNAITTKFTHTHNHTHTNRFIHKYSEHTRWLTSFLSWAICLWKFSSFFRAVSSLSLSRSVICCFNCKNSKKNWKK